MANITYKRVSTKEQNLDRQTDMMKKYGPFERVFEEKISGASLERLQLNEMLGFVRKGDTVYIESISRLARNLRDFLEIFEQINKKEVQLISVKENIDTTSATGRLQIHIFAALAEFERECMKERQREGIESAKARGKHLGRPAREFSVDWGKVYKRWEVGEITVSEAIKMLNITKATFYNMIERWIEKTGKQPKRWENGQKVELRKRTIFERWDMSPIRLSPLEKPKKK